MRPFGVVPGAGWTYLCHVERAQVRDEVSRAVVEPDRPVRIGDAQGAARRPRGAVGTDPADRLAPLLARAVADRAADRASPPYEHPAPRNLLLRKSGLSLPQQAQRYFDQGEEEVARTNHQGAALLFTRAFRSDKKFHYALAAATAFRLVPDVANAVMWFRRVLDTTPGTGSRDTACLAARLALTDLNTPELAKHRMRLDVKDDYVRINKKVLIDLGIDPTKVREAKRQGLTKEQISAADVLKQQQDTLKREVEAAERLTDLTAKADAKLRAEAKFQEAVTKLRVVLTDVPDYRVAYVSSGDRLNYKLGLQADRIIQGPPPGLPGGYTTAASYSKEAGDGYAIYVMSPDGDIYVSGHEVGRFHHSSFLAGGEAAGAGEVKIIDGRVIALTNKSGHYAPTYVHVAQTLREFRDSLGQDLSQVELILHVGKVLRWKTKAAGFLALFEAGPQKPGSEVSKLFGDEETAEVEVLTGGMP